MRKLAVILFAVMLVLAGCDPSSNKDGVGELRIYIPSSRGIETVSMDTANYKISGSGPDGTSFSETVPKSGVNDFSVPIRAGEWNINVEALNADDQIIGGGTATAMIVADKSNTCTVQVREYDGPGTLNIMITPIGFSNPETTDLSVRICKSLDSPSSVPAIDLVLSDGVFSLSNHELQNGFYVLYIYDGDTLVESVAARIVKGYVTTLKADYISSDFGTGYLDIEDLIAPTPSIEISLVRSSIPKNLDIVATAVVNGLEDFSPTYKWFINGVDIGVTSLDLSKSLENYDLTVGQSYKLVLQVTAEDLVWTEGVTFSVTEAVTFPSSLEHDFGSDKTLVYGDDDLNVSIKSDVLSYSVSWLIDNEPIPNQDGTSLNLYDVEYPIGTHMLSCKLESNGYEKKYDIGTFFVKPKVSIVFDKLSFTDKEPVTGYVSFTPSDYIASELSYVSINNFRGYLDNNRFSLIPNVTGSESYPVSLNLSIDGRSYEYGNISYIRIEEVDYWLSSQYTTIEHGDSFSAYVSGYGGNDIKWYLDGKEIYQQSPSCYLSVYDVEWSIGEHSLYAIIGGISTNSITFSVAERTGYEFYSSCYSSNGQLYLDVYSSNYEGSYSVKWYNAENNQLLGEGTDKSPFKLEVSGQWSYSLKYEVTYSINGAEKVYTGETVESNSFVSLSIKKDKSFYLAGELPKLSIENYDNVPIDGVEVSINDGTDKTVSPDSEGIYVLPSDATYYDGYNRFVIKIHFGERTQSYDMSFIRVVDGFVPLSPQSVYQNINIVDKTDYSLAEMTTIVLGANNQYAIYNMGITDNFTEDEEGNSLWDRPKVDVQTGEYSVEENTYTLGERLFTVTQDGLSEKVGTSSLEYKKLNSVASSLGYNGSWKMTDINPDSSVLNAMLARTIDPMLKKLPGFESYDTILSFDSEECVGAALQLEIDDGYIKGLAEVDIDASGFDNKLNLADGISAYALGSTTYTENDGFLKIADYSIPVYVQVSEDGSVLLVYYVGYQGGEYLSFVVPFTRTSAFNDITVGGSPFSSEKKAGITELLIAAKQAEELNGVSFVDMFATSVGEIFLSGKYNITVDGELPFAIGSEMYSVMNTLTFGKDSSLHSYTYEGETHWNGNGGWSYEVSATGSTDEAVIIIKAKKDGHPIKEAKITATKDMNASVQDVIGKMFEYLVDSENQYVSFDANGDIWVRVMYDDSLKIGTYGIGNGYFNAQIDMTSFEFLFSHFEGALKAGIRFPYENDKLMILENVGIAFSDVE